MFKLLIPFFLIILIGIFTASETAFLCIEKIRLKKAYDEKKTWANRVYRFTQKPSQFFTMILVCEDFLLVLGSTILAQGIIQTFGNNWLVISTIIMSLFSLIVGQYLPKAIALNNPEKILAVLSELLHLIYTILAPIILLFSTIATFIGNLFKRHTSLDRLRYQDIIFAVSEYEKDTSLLVSRLFVFSRIKIGEIMIPIGMALLCSKDDDIASVCARTQRIFTRIPVYEGNVNNIIGVINTKDYFYTGNLTLEPPFFVNINDRCMAVFIKMQKENQKMGIVQDDRGNVVGIITLWDLIEELVGEIREEV